MHIIPPSLALAVLSFINQLVAAQYAAIPRWGQAVALVQDVLYIHGGRTDPYNSFSYTSAPVSNDLFSLSLTSPFSPASPDFQYIGGCSNCSSSQGPAVAWHSITPFNTSSLLLFGGDPGPNSPVVIPTNDDSAVLLDVSNTIDPTWNFETQSWAGEPMRRIYHSAASSQGKVWIIGGEKADGSGTAFSEHYVFDPKDPSFTQLPSTNGPSDITGHQAIVLNDGRLIVFGGFSPSEKSLIPLTTVWVLDTTQTNPSWSTIPVSNTLVPPPRRGFAAALVDSGQVLIHGGADADLQNSLQDGWILDTTKTPMEWTAVSTLSQLGPRRDHFAVGLGTVVIFGFGYAQNGAASATLEIFDLSSGSFVTSYTPPVAVTTPTLTTLPVPGQTNDPSHTGGTNQPGSAEYPSPTVNPGHNGTGTPNTPSADADNSHHGTTIALATVFGVLALAAATTAVSWYIKRRHSRESFHLLGGSGDEESPTSGAPIPVVEMRDKGLPSVPVVRTVKDRLSRIVPGIAPSQTLQGRRDMLADEDASSWYAVRRDPSSGQSSWASRRRPTLDKVYDSLASLRSAGGAMLDLATGAAVAGARSLKSRQASASSDPTAWKEKRQTFDPYSDDFGLMQYSPPVLTASRPRGGREASSYSYTNPFEEYEVESLDFDPEKIYYDDEYDGRREFPFLNDPPPRPKIQTMATPATLDLTRLTPVSEQFSVPTLTESMSASDTSLSQSAAHSPFFASSSSSHEPQSPSRRPSSIIDANPHSSHLMRRSNSWWSRFARTPLLERALSDSSRTQRHMDFRDPNPPPRLVTIEESLHSNSPDTPENKRKSRSGSGGHHQLYSTHHHGRSASSLQTARTADSETLERMANTMQIVQQGSMSSRHSGPSRSTSGGDEAALIDYSPGPSPTRVQPTTGRPLSVVSDRDSHGLDEALSLVQSPSEMTHEDTSRRPILDLGSPKRPSPTERVSSGSKVAERVQAYERRMSQQELVPPKSPPAIPTRARTSAYGVAPKPSLFVANPDHRHASSGSS